MNKQIWLAGGCFWGLQAYLDRLYGVNETVVGYANGNTDHPTYEQVCYQHTGHAETVFVDYDNERISLSTLLEYYFKVVDPTTAASNTAAAFITRTMSTCRRSGRPSQWNKKNTPRRSSLKCCR